MSGKVGINYDVFEAEVNNLKSDVNEIDFQVKVSLSTTTIDPFKGYQTAIDELSSAIKQYKTISSQDIARIQMVGQEIRDRDQDVANNMGN